VPCTYERIEGFTAKEIARRTYGWIERVKRKHTFAVRRSLISVMKRNPD
jgi:hypothetical protein